MKFKSSYTFCILLVCFMVVKANVKEWKYQEDDKKSRDDDSDHFEVYKKNYDEDLLEIYKKKHNDFDSSFFEVCKKVHKKNFKFVLII